MVLSLGEELQVANGYREGESVSFTDELLYSFSNPE